MGKRTNTATWSEKHQRWQINVQQDGTRRSFYSSTPGRTGQREANAKADAWLDEGIEGANTRVSALYEEFIQSQKESTGQGHWRSVVSRYNNLIAPAIGHKRIDRLREQDLQDVINRAYSQHGYAAKTLGNIRSDLLAFVKYCRRKKATTLLPEGLTIPASAKRPEKHVIQPRDLLKLFNCDTTIYRGKRTFEPYIHAFRLEVLTGMRPGEVNGLEWADVRGNEIHLKRSKNIYGEITQGKNKNAVRVVTLSALALAELDAQTDRRRTIRVWHFFHADILQALASISDRKRDGACHALRAAAHFCIHRKAASRGPCKVSGRPQPEYGHLRRVRPHDRGRGKQHRPARERSLCGYFEASGIT